MTEHELASRLERIESLLTSLVDQEAKKEYYTTAEVAKILGRAEFTVREWCRLGRIWAEKRQCGRGVSKEWMISHEELQRIRNEGLLPLQTRTSSSSQPLIDEFVDNAQQDGHEAIVKSHATRRARKIAETSSSLKCVFLASPTWGNIVSFPIFCMPNHVRNTVTMSGPDEILLLIDNAVRTNETPFDFNRVIPRPAVVDLLCAGALTTQEMRSHPNRNWYDWCIAHWGTKWNAYDFKDATPGDYTFFTAWDPPVPVIQSLSWLFPEVEITLDFDEPNMEMCDSYSYKAGEKL